MIQNVRIVVAGDAKVGKTSLIRTLVSEHFAQDGDATLDSWLREVNIAPDNMGAEKVSLTIVDTPSFSWRNASGHSQESEDHVKKKNAVCREIANANVVVLVYDVNRNSTFLNIKRHWLPLIRDDIEGPSKPIVLVGNKLDLQPKFQMRRYSAMTQRYAPILRSFKMVDACVECSCKNLFNIQEVFYYARKAVIYPVKPLYDLDGREIKMRADFQRALRRCFRIFDRDRDNLWYNAELRKFQSMIFDTNLQDADIDGVHKVLSQKEGDNIRGATGKGRALTLDGFLCLNRIFLERNLDETSWLVLRALNYKVKSPEEFDELELETPEKIFDLKVNQNTSMELTQSGISFFEDLFTQFDSKGKGVLTSADMCRVFDICPSEYRTLLPASESFPRNSLSSRFRDDNGSENGDDETNDKVSSKYQNKDVQITREYWTALWSALTLLRPDLTQRYLFYLGYNLPVDDISQALRVTRSRAVEFESNNINRKVLRVFVFGRKGVGKTTLLRRIARRTFAHPGTDSKRDSYRAQHYVGTREFFAKEKATTTRRHLRNEEAEDTLLVFTEWPHSAISRGLEAGRSLKDILNEIEDGTSMESCDVALLIFEPPISEDGGMADDDDGGFDVIARVQKELSPYIPCLFLCNKWDRRPTGFEASDEWAGVTRFVRSLQLELPLGANVTKGNNTTTSESSIRTLPLQHNSASSDPSIHYDRVFDNLVLSAKQPQSMCPMYASKQRELREKNRQWMARLSIAIGTLGVLCIAGAYTYWYRKGNGSSKRNAGIKKS